MGVKASRSFGRPDAGLLKVWQAPRAGEGAVIKRTPQCDELIRHLATDGPMLISQAARRLTGNDKDPAGQRQVKRWLQVGWLEVCDWQAVGPSGVRVRQVVRLVGLGPGAIRQYGIRPRWGWDAMVVCRGVTTAQLLLRLPAECRWRPMQPQRPLVGRLDLDGRKAWVVVLRRSRDMQRQVDGMLADFTRSDVGAEDRVWIVVPSDEPEDQGLATRLVREGDLAERALLTSDSALWDPDRPLHTGFSRWAAAGWQPVLLANLREVEQRERERVVGAVP